MTTHSPTPPHSAPFLVPAEKCGHEHLEIIGQTSEGTSSWCPDCGTQFSVSRAELDRVYQLFMGKLEARYGRDHPWVRRWHAELAAASTPLGDVALPAGWTLGRCDRCTRVGVPVQVRTVSGVAWHFCADCWELRHEGLEVAE